MAATLGTAKSSLVWAAGAGADVLSVAGGVEADSPSPAEDLLSMRNGFLDDELERGLLTLRRKFLRRMRQKRRRAEVECKRIAAFTGFGRAVREAYTRYCKARARFGRGGLFDRD